ncbi:MAG: hypothetical protein WBL95_17935 [Microcoleus sp.]
MRFAEKVWLDFVSKNKGAISWGMALLARAFGERAIPYGIASHARTCDRPFGKKVS